MFKTHFKTEAEVQGSRARAGRFNTLHGEILTPLFMPVGTQASVRNVNAHELDASGSQILLANTYHLFLRPGKEVFDQLGPIHKFMKWKHSVLTDSGGYQVFSLSASRKISEEGVIFQSYVDGKLHMLSPETSIGMQKSIGSDIMMAMDVCIPSTSDFAMSKDAMERTHRWAVRSLEARGDSPQSIFGIVQGACHESLRKESAEFIASQPFDGLAIGGLAVGETKEERERFTEVVTSFLPKDRPRYLMGVGTPIDLLEAVHRGVDMFDCIIPTQLAEQGVVFTSQGRMQLGRGVYKFADEVLDPDCPCPTCKTHSRAYLHHLVKTCEPLSTQLLGAHNIYFYHQLMRRIRIAILEGSFLSFYAKWREILTTREVVTTSSQPKVGRRPARRPDRLGDFELHLTRDRKPSIKHTPSTEVMHPGDDPMDEARLLYVEQSQILKKLEELKEGEECVVWDVGLGAAFNAMALVFAVEKLAEEKELKGKLRLISFEKDLNALRLALYHPAHFPHLRHGGPHAILDGATYESEHLVWELKEGDFLDFIESSPAPDRIFFDPYSYKTDAPLWSLECFERIRKQCGLKQTILYNYTSAASMRARLLLAGFYVAKGEASPPKKETTIAFTHVESSPAELLGSEWIERLEKNEAKAEIMPSTEWNSVLALLLSHPQFNVLTS